MNDIARLKEAIALYEAKVRAQGLVVNARDAEHLDRLKTILAELETITNTNNQNR